MASVRREIVLDQSPDVVWEAARDFGAPHQRLFPGVLTDAYVDGDARVVTFANGLVVRERLVVLDDAARRVAWAAAGGTLAHHNASIEVRAEPAGGSRVVWITDFLPHEAAPAIGALVDAGAAALQRTFGSR